MVFPDPIDPEIISTGTVALISIQNHSYWFKRDRASAKNAGLAWRNSEVGSRARGGSKAVGRTGIGLGVRLEAIADCSLHGCGVKAVSPLTRVARGANLARPPRLPRLESKCAASNAAG